jgi:PAS domain S-box-containing protein
MIGSDDQHRDALTPESEGDVTLATGLAGQSDTLHERVSQLTTALLATTREALKDSEGRTARRERILTTTLSCISDFAYIYDREGRFLFVNQPLLDLWGIPLAAAVGRNFFDLGYPTELAAQLQRQIEDVFTTRQVIVGETPYTSPTGQNGF